MRRWFRDPINQVVLMIVVLMIIAAAGIVAFGQTPPPRAAPVPATGAYLQVPEFVNSAYEAGWQIESCWKLNDPGSSSSPWNFCVQPDGTTIAAETAVTLDPVEVVPLQAQTPPPPTTPSPTPGYYTIFMQPAGSPAGNAAARYAWYGPDPSLAACLSDLNAIMNATMGIGSTAWFWKPYTICYSYP